MILSIPTSISSSSLTPRKPEFSIAGIGKRNSGVLRNELPICVVNLERLVFLFVTFLVEKTLGQAMERRIVASLYVWLVFFAGFDVFDSRLLLGSCLIRKELKMEKLNEKLFY
ncbi:hypothetical protein L1987_64919 [Smallanthus sonchifolius]|uniref:Uncharacterized protein n=1 Tax=Smallanthus sonchifolius TaxID=185202 RepID=A0ACB9BSY3_9ASTR|nr:hypothetical protein L1987_64919 [Smallanthus sonchifolius]